MLKIKSVEKGSVGYELKLKPGDEIVSFNGNLVEDILDYFYYDSEDEFEMEVSRNGKVTLYEIEKSLETLGLEFECDNLTAKQCRNKCVFCFVDQLPKGLRETLYVKDDDYRLSFLCGNYITLTNLSKADIERIIRLKLSPLYVSVHAISSPLREKLLTNRFAGNVLDIIKELTNNGITINCQVVSCPNLNDGKELTSTLNELFSLYPMVNSVAVVPVGLTKYRDDLYPLKHYTKDEARAVVSLIENFAKLAKEKTLSNFVYASDEFYIDGELALPSYESYEDFPQIENGVGLVRKFEYEFNCAVDKNKVFNKRKTVIITGASFYPFLEKMLSSVNCPHELILAKNSFFGSDITVAGLLTSKDIIASLGGMQVERVLISKNCLREFGDVFLDDVKVSDLEKQINAEIVAVLSSGEVLYQEL